MTVQEALVIRLTYGAPAPENAAVGYSAFGVSVEEQMRVRVLREEAEAVLWAEAKRIVER